MNPIVEAPLCVATLIGAVFLLCLFEATIGRWLRGRHRYIPPEQEPQRPASYDASAWTAWPEDAA